MRSRVARARSRRVGVVLAGFLTAVIGGAILAEAYTSVYH